MDRLVKTLIDLKEQRRLSSECEEMIQPFIGKVFDARFGYKESSSTFASRLGDEFKGGKTVIAEILDAGLDCSLLYPESENEQVASYKQGDEFHLKVKVLEFDNLYQRVVFGFCSDSTPEESTLEEDIPVDGMQDTLESEMEDVFTDPKDEIEDSEKDFDDPAVTEETNVSAEQVAQEKVSEPPANDAEQPIEKEDFTQEDSELSSEDDSFKESDAFEKKDVKKMETPPPLPPPLPENKSKIQNDPNHLDELRNKRYEHGTDSLTDEEKKALEDDIKINAASRQKDLEVNKEKVNKGARIFFGFIMVVFSLNSCDKGGGFFAFMVFCVGLYLLFPLVKKLKEFNEMD